MDDDKRILVFSDAGGTGRSYHADLGARNQRLRAHYLLEAGWKADTAIQGLGRSNRTNPPITTFLNRLLALTIALQNTLFSTFEELLRDPAGDAAMSSLARRAEIAGIEMLGLSPRFDDLNEDLRRVGVEQLGALVRHQLVTQDVVRFVDSAATEAA